MTVTERGCRHRTAPAPSIPGGARPPVGLGLAPSPSPTFLSPAQAEAPSTSVLRQQVQPPSALQAV